ncbi:N-acyl homoserine lactonase AttM, partial [Dysosmobacter welbionis]
MYHLGPGVLDPAHVAEAAALAAVLHRCRLLSSSSPRRYLSFSRVDLRISRARRRLIALVGRNGSELLSTLLVLHGKQLELYLHLLGLGGPLLFLLQPLFQILLGFSGSRIMQLFHFAPKQNQRLRAAGIAECPRLQVHPGLLPHGLPVGGQRGGVVTAEQELVFPIILAVLVLLQEVVPADLFVDRVPLVVLVADGPGLVAVRQPELEHQLEQLGVCRLLHGPLALQTSRRLCGRKLLGLSAGGRGVRPALEGIRDAQNLPGFFIDRRQVRQLV